MLLHASRAARRLWPHLRDLPRQAAEALGGPGLETPPRPIRLWQTFGIVLPIAGAAAWTLPHLTIVMSPSVDAWAVVAAPGPIGRDDLVSFTLSHPLAGPKPVRVTKYALCLPGERIDWVEYPSQALPGATEATFYCEDRLIGVSKPVGHNGQRLEHWRPAYHRMPAGYIYVGSEHPSGFDSRYYGPIPIERLTRVEKLL
jgi:conjugal transfer pilin signal peptidase TrbI